MSPHSTTTLADPVSGLLHQLESEAYVRPLRALAFHGLCSHPKVMQHQTAGLRFATKKTMTWDFIEAPYIFPVQDSARDAEVLNMFKGVNAKYWYDPKDRQTRRKAIQFVCDYIAQEGPFDILVGFSQGGAMCSLLTLYMENDLLPKNVPKWHCVLNLCAIEPEAPYDDLSDLSEVAPDYQIQTPALFTIGRADHEYGHRTQRLIDQWDSQSYYMVYHNEGHKIPAGIKYGTKVKVALDKLRSQFKLSQAMS